MIGKFVCMLTAFGSASIPVPARSELQLVRTISCPESIWHSWSRDGKLVVVTRKHAVLLMRPNVVRWTKCENATSAIDTVTGYPLALSENGESLICDGYRDLRSRRNDPRMKYIPHSWVFCKVSITSGRVCYVNSANSAQACWSSSPHTWFGFATAPRFSEYKDCKLVRKGTVPGVFGNSQLIGSLNDGTFIFIKTDPEDSDRNRLVLTKPGEKRERQSVIIAPASQHPFVALNHKRDELFVLLEDVNGNSNAKTTKWELTRYSVANGLKREATQRVFLPAGLTEVVWGPDDKTLSILLGKEIRLYSR